MKKMIKKEDGLLNWSDMHTIGGKSIFACMFVIMLIVALVCLVPVVWMFVSSFKTPQELYAMPPKFFPSSVDFGSILKVFSKARMSRYLFNSLCIIVGCLACDIILNGLAGYVLSRIRPKGSAFLETILFWTMMLPGISMVPLYMTFVDMPIIHVNLTGSFVGLWLMAGTNAFTIFMFRNFFNSIPMDYLEAARIDGCSNLGAFFKIIIPLAAPIIMVETIFSVIGSWGNFFWPYLLLQGTKKEPISILLYNLTTFNSSFLDNERMMIMMLATIPALIVFAIFSRKIMGGVNMSGIKG